MILVGTSGWSHDAWVGAFYPVQLRDSPDAWLRYYATRFRSVEITSTFDAFPDEELVAAWSREGVALQDEGLPFEFSVKLPREVTHDALPAGDVQRAWEVAARFERVVLEPLADEGLLGAVLVQLPPAARAEPGLVAALQEVLRALAGRSVALEPRHASWSEGGRVAPLAADLFASPDVCLAQLDAPGAPRFAEVPAARHAYVRFHGRRPDGWTDPPLEGGSRYDYKYEPRELLPWAELARSAEGHDRVVRLYFNNAPRARAPANAIELLHLLGEAGAVRPVRLLDQTRLPV